MKLFYCPKCKKLDLDFDFKDRKEEKEITTWTNIRYGFGMPIKHVICSSCGNVLAGVINRRYLGEDEVEYYKEIITMYNKEIKYGGYIENGKLEWLVNDIKSRKGLK